MDFKNYFEKNKVKVSDKDYIAVKLGGLITAARLHAGFSQEKLAKKIGTKQPSIARAEKGEVIPSIEFLYKIAKAVKSDFIFPKFGFMDGGSSKSSVLYSIMFMDHQENIKKTNSSTNVLNSSTYSKTQRLTLDN